MGESPFRNVALLCCIDPRHSKGKLTLVEAFEQETGATVYPFSVAGGGASYALLNRDPAQCGQIKEIMENRLGLEIGTVILVGHIPSDHDPNGCKKLALSGHGHHFKGPDCGHGYMSDILQKSVDLIRPHVEDVQLMAYCCGFGKYGENIIHRVEVQEAALVGAQW